jgi:Fe-S oxidoreductase/FAD/FMN-containing dehydrogenase
MGGKTVDNVIELDVLTYDGLRLTVGPTSDEQLAAYIAAGDRRGTIYRSLKALRDRYAELVRARFPKIPRRVSGYNLDQLLPENGFNVARALVGTEGTCVTVLGARVRLVDSPPGRALLVLGYPDVYAAGDHICEILEHGPIGLEGIDDRLIADMKAVRLHPDDIELLPSGRGWLMVEFGAADRREARQRAQECMAVLRKQQDAPSMKLFDDPREEQMLWTVRKSGLGATAHVPNRPVTWEGWEDSAVPPEKLGSYLRELRALLGQFGYNGDLYGHFGQGCVHTRIDFDLETAAGIGKFRAFLTAAANLVVRYGGSISGEHGDGQSKADLLPAMFGPELVHAFGEFKAIWDPQDRMNPGKVVHPYSPGDNLRLGTHYNPKPRTTEFVYPKDAGNFGRTMLRCVGVGECRRKSGKTMCPSYRATLEEKHSTRGRARLLFEMMRGDVLTGGWRDTHVRESLDLCLACKGCLGDCPVHVDMATYKAEFLSHYYAGRLRPRAAYAFGLIDRWARIASHVPAVTNALGTSPITGPALRALADIARERRLPRFAHQSFQRWFGAQSFARRKRPQVLLWPDTFNNYFHPETARAALRVLDAVGFDVTVPSFHVCCGRPLYDFGMLDRARRYLQHILHRLGTQIDAGIPFVVLEPACAATFRHELQLLLPDEERAKRLAQQTFFFCEFLKKQHVTPFTGGRAGSKVLLHGHCHQRAVANLVADRSSLEAAGCDVHVLDAGCCGMAGSFGFERRKYPVSQRIGELAVFPAVRGAAPDTRIVGDGFSCREQIEQATGRRVWHSAEVMAAALDAS